MQSIPSQALRPALVSVVAAVAFGFGVANAQSAADGDFVGQANAGVSIYMSVKDGELTAYSVPGCGTAKKLGGRIEADATAKADHVTIRTIKVEPDGRAFTIHHDTGQRTGRVEMRIQD